MPSKLQDEDIEVDEAPTGINPYAVLSLDEDATADQIKTAYRKAALKHHPDKAAPEDKDEAHTKFQEVAFAYAILSDEKRRRRYDTTGNTSDSLDLDDDDFDWTTFFREQFKNVVTGETIDNFAQTYKGSDEERGHVLAVYEKHAGNMDKLYQDVMLSDVLEDDERFRAIIDKAIEDEEVEGHKKYTHESEKSRKARITTARKRKAIDAKDAEKAAKELEEEATSKKGRSKGGKKGDTADLAALIQQRQKGRAEGFFEHLEDKYAVAPSAKPGKKGSKRAAPVEVDEPSEEAFAKNRKASRAGSGEVDATEGARRSKRAKRTA
ncbi:hypothetical protein LTR36_002544 [Oleoguttula mirabilis]|uniref:J domain-containing protein n=1 Tax=Oleoguttula mirabilis TaxID=1507867 RepID=A0AAV9JL42_9PEZI|nr:hypothetical protein LTR36_002544 [Oleoguttula mirabilis]